jgi:hypothetical protein
MRFERQAMIGIRSGDGGHRFRHIERFSASSGCPCGAATKILRVSHRARAEAEEVRVERQDDIRLIEAIDRGS